MNSKQQKQAVMRSKIYAMLDNKASASKIAKEVGVSYAHVKNIKAQYDFEKLNQI